MSGNSDNFDENDDLWLDDAQIDALFAVTGDSAAATEEFGELGAVLSSLKVALLDVPEIAPSPELAEFINVADGELLSDLPPLDAVDVEVELADFDVDEMLRVLTTPEELISARSAVRHGRGAWWGSLAAACVAAVLLIATIGIPSVGGGSGFSGDRSGPATVADQPAIVDAAPVEDGSSADASLVDGPAPAVVDPAPVERSAIDEPAAVTVDATSDEPPVDEPTADDIGQVGIKTEAAPKAEEPAALSAAPAPKAPVAEQTAPVDPAPAPAPAVVEQAPVEPASAPVAPPAPAVVEPAPVVAQPAPAVTTPVQPVPVAPAPVVTEPVPVPVRPAPVAAEPAPVVPEPVAPAPVVPAPVDPGPSSSAPTAPVAEPAPAGPIQIPSGPGGDGTERPPAANGG